MDPIDVYIGWDSREPIAAEVCRYSLLKHASIPVNVHYLKRNELIEQGLYTRDTDPLSSTEFTFTRFLVPTLQNYEGTAIFMDSDMIWLTDIAELLAEVDPTKAVTCVHHDYTPPEGVKMDGQQQLHYPRKNWSSMVVWNCGHKENRKVTVKEVNNWSGAELHRFMWLDDKHIGKISPEWNWLVGWYREGRDGEPKILHYTEGGPWFNNYRNCEYADTWNSYLAGYEDSKRNVTHTIEDLTLSQEMREFFTLVKTGLTDPYSIFADVDVRYALTEIIRKYSTPGVVGIVDSGYWGLPDDAPEKPRSEMKMDKILESFLLGSKGVFGGSKRIEEWPKDIPLAVRGIAKKKVMHHCLETKRDFYYIDTGYFGNAKHKHYHRITKNALQYSIPLWRGVPEDRFLKTDTTLKRWYPGRNILLCPPSQKALTYWGVDLQVWLDETVNEIKKHTNRPIVIREKQSRHTRVNEDTMEMALSRDVHCMVTYNSIAAVESLILGKPVFTMGPNAAQPLANTDLSKIENPHMPTLDEVRHLCCNLAYNQFTPKEMQDGTAWAILQENYAR